MTRGERKTLWLGLAFISPWIVGVLVFAQPFVMLGGGGPNRSALFYAVYLYQNAFEYRQMGYACAMAWVLFILILILTWAATRTTRRHIYYAGE